MSINGRIGAFIAVAGLPAIVYGGGIIHEFNASLAEIGSGTSFSSTTDLPVTLNTNTRYVDIIPSSNSDDIPLLTFSGGPSDGRVRIYLGADATSGFPDFDEEDHVVSKAGLNLKGIHATSLNGTCESEFYGGITVDRLVRFDAGGTIRGNFIIANPGGTATPVCVVEADTITSTASISLADGDLTRVKTTGVETGSTGRGGFAASITVGNGDIGSIVSSEGLGGTGDAPIQAPQGKIASVLSGRGILQVNNSTATTPMILARDGIDSIEALLIAARITANYGTGATGDIHRIVTNNSGISIWNEGRIEARRFIATTSEDRFDLPGNMGAHLIMEELAEGNTLSIGHSLTPISTGSTASVTITGASGLKGQIIVNASNAAGQVWNAPVTVGSTTLSGPYYTNTSASLGGGAVGLVPFNLHKEDSSILALSTSLPGTSALSPIILSPAQFSTGLDLSFYGPIKARVSGVAPMRFLRDYTMNGIPFAADLTCRTIQTIAPSGTSGSRAARTIRVKGDPTNPMAIGLYRLTTDDPSDSSVLYRCDTDPFTDPPARTFLDCAGLPTGVTRKVGGFTIWIKIAVAVDGCPADIDNDGDYTNGGTPDNGVDINDLISFLGAFEAGDFFADLDDGSGTGTPDNGVDIDDLLFFLAHFEMGC